jgi:glycosyltransferase involved in cell wall biosynthesis
MKIVHTLLRYPPATGGVEEYTHELVERLREKGEDVSVETTNLKTHHPPTLLPSPLDDPPHIHRHAAQTFDAIGYPIPQGLKEELSAMPMDILHAHAFWYAPADIAARVAKRRNIAFVLNPYYTNAGNRHAVKWQLYRILYGRATVAAADAVVVISPFEREQLQKDRFLFQRVELIPPGIDASEFQQSAPNPFPQWGINHRDILLFAGRIARAKGVDLLLRALPRIRRQCPNTHAVIIGEDFGFRSECEVLATELGVADAVTWTGKVSRSELLGAYEHARVFVLPSRFEAFGIVLLEAGASGCPVVATRGSAIPYVVRDEETGLLFEPDDVADLAKKVLALLHNPTLAKRLSERAKDRARTEFTWDKSVTKLHALYTDLLKKRA